MNRQDAKNVKNGKREDNKGRQRFKFSLSLLGVLGVLAVYFSVFR